MWPVHGISTWPALHCGGPGHSLVQDGVLRLWECQAPHLGQALHLDAGHPASHVSQDVPHGCSAHNFQYYLKMEFITNIKKAHVD